ncbi:unnamed protein product [Vicia faba]|uniref:Uncharacterized protein n=1 Tax=Vicia faba TaxID=3906 RepID=A0AAV0ZHA2_VICFA|nr:unnamed protein product [Vicia faba]
MNDEQIRYHFLREHSVIWNCYSIYGESLIEVSENFRENSETSLRSLCSNESSPQEFATGLILRRYFGQDYNHLGVVLVQHGISRNNGNFGQNCMN